MNKTIKLTNGEFLFRDYSKYGCKLAIISPVEEIEWQEASPEDFNLPTAYLQKMVGEYYVSKKGTKCFHIKEDGPHILLRDPWGGAFNKYRGGNLPQDNLYFHRASSNAGGCGSDYAVVPKEWVNELDVEDI